MKPSRSRNQTELDEQDYGPSRTQQRRDALAVLTLAQQLIDLPPSRLAKLDMPDDVRREIDITQHMSAHGARKRQLAFLAKVMRRYDAEDFAVVRAALGENREKQRQETASMHRMEALRERLIADEASALPELIGEYPQLDCQRLRALIRQARAEKETPAKPPKAYREIFRLLKELDHGESAADT